MSERHIARILETQLERAHNFAWDMFIDLTHDEFFWEPVVWKGPGQAGWIDTGGASPITTIAWPLTHMSSCQITYHQDVFDSGDRRFEEGAALLCNSLRELDDADLLKPPAKPKPFEIRQSWVGLNQEPLWQLFTAPTAIHVTHHAAEVGRMRDLYTHSGLYGPD